MDDPTPYELRVIYVQAQATRLGLYLSQERRPTANHGRFTLRDHEQSLVSHATLEIVQALLAALIAAQENTPDAAGVWVTDRLQA